MSGDGRRVRVWIPRHLRTLASLDEHAEEVVVDVREPVCARSVLDALEERLPVLRGTIREHGGGRRRAMVRLFICQEDWSHEDPERPLPESVVAGEEAVHVIGAMSGG